MLRKIFVIEIFIIEYLILEQWFACQRFKDFIHLSSTNMGLYIKDLTNNDAGIPLFIVRFFHNKIIAFFNLLLQYYLRFWDDRFILNLLSIVGCFGMILGVWYLLVRNLKYRKYLRIALIYLLVIPLTEILYEPRIGFIYKIIFLTLPLQLFSLFGIWKFLGVGRNYFRMIIVLILIVLSVWWMRVLPADIYNYCVR